MQQLLIGVILVLGGVTYYLHSQNQILQANNSALEGAVATQEEAIKTYLKRGNYFRNIVMRKSDGSEVHLGNGVRKHGKRHTS